MRVRWWIVGGCAVALLLVGASAIRFPAATQPPDKIGGPAPAKEVACRWAGGPIQLDGKADEPAWKKAQVVANFAVPWLGKKARPAKTATKARLLWDDQYLYFFADMVDADLYADVKEHNGICWENDVFELFFKPAEKKLGYYEFQVNAAGTTLEMYLPSRGAGGYRRFKDAGGTHIEAKVILRGTLNNWKDRDDGWAVEGRIPWQAFQHTGGKPAAGAVWKFCLCRYDYSVDFEQPELSTCAPLSQPNFHYYEDYLPLRFVGSEKKGKT